MSNDQATSYFDYLKHLSTLSTGSIVVEIALFEKVFAHPQWKAVAALSLLALTTSVVASVVHYTASIYISAGKTFIDPGGDLVLVSLFLTWGGFIVGIVTLMVFSLKNLFQL